uniref:GNAT family N-acetyltransferase n=1 Tax=Prevotella sp. TaxID=59823 RepID=UPI004028A3AC
MLYEIAHTIRGRMPWLWQMTDRVNSMLFTLRYDQKVKQIEKMWGEGIPYTIVPLRCYDAEEISHFFAHQPAEAFRFFRPHGFDVKSIRQLQKNRAFLAYMLEQEGTLVGYFFLRSFFWGKCFRGRMVDIDWRGKGIGTLMNCLMNRLGYGLGMHIFETVSADNVASLKSAQAASDIRVLKRLPSNDLYIEVLPKKTNL